MIEIKSKRETQVIQITETSAGVKIKVVDRKYKNTTIHVFDECIAGLIAGLLKARKNRKEKRGEAESASVAPKSI